MNNLKSFMLPNYYTKEVFHMIQTLINNFTFHVLCSSIYFGLYIINCYIFKIKKARLPYKIMLTGLLPYLNLPCLLMQICFFSTPFINILSKLTDKRKTSTTINKLVYSNKKSNTDINMVPKKA